MKEYTKLNDILNDLDEHKRNIYQESNIIHSIMEQYEISCLKCKDFTNNTSEDCGNAGKFPRCLSPNKEWIKAHKGIEVTK